jgi:hypothetical protein
MTLREKRREARRTPRRWREVLESIARIFSTQVVDFPHLSEGF